MRIEHAAEMHGLIPHAERRPVVRALVLMGITGVVFVLFAFLTTQVRAVRSGLQAGQFAVAIQPMASGEEWFFPDAALVWEDHRHAGSDRTLPKDKRALALD